METKKQKRCYWVNDVTQRYHDEEWCVPSFDDRYLFEMLVLETFQASLSWEIILKKREGFRKAFADFDYTQVAAFSEETLQKLMMNTDIVRHKEKIRATVHTARSFMAIQKEFGSFSNYIWSFTGGKTIRNIDKEYSERKILALKVSNDLKGRGIKYMGPATTFAYLLAIGVLNDHQRQCYKFPGNSKS